MYRFRDSWPGMLLAVIVGLIVTITPAAAEPAAPARTGDAPQGGLGDLPLPARFAISRVLGRDDRAYRAVARAGGYAFDNPAQGLKAAFGNGQAAVRLGAVGLRLRLTGVGYGEALQPPGEATPAAPEPNRVEYRREGLTEWYVNGPLGLQQGFTLHRRPPAGGAGPLTLALTVAGAVETAVDAGRRGMTVRVGKGGPRLRYDGLLAYDARGRELPVWLEAGAGDVRLQVEDAGAVYPLVVDPFIHVAKLTSSRDSSMYRVPRDHLGWSVAISGDTVVVGAPGHDAQEGAAYVFVRPAGGWASMTDTAELTASDGTFYTPPYDGYHFGESVAVSGGTIVVGAPDADYFIGAAYVFERPAGGWVDMTETAKLTASDYGGLGFSDFGQSVSISGDTVVVGSRYLGDPDPFTVYLGAVYVFERPAGGWADMTQTAKLSAEGLSGYHLRDVAISGDTLVAGASGGAVVFERPVGGWVDMTQTAKLTVTDGGVSGLGRSVAISGNTVVVGAAWSDVRGKQDQGAAYVFERPAGSWADTTETAKLTASDGAAGDNFGESVAIGDGKVVVGAYKDDIGGQADQGSAYVFVRPDGGWADMTETAKLTAPDGAEGDWFGKSVALSDNGTIIVGAPYHRVYSGAAYAFENTIEAPTAAELVSPAATVGDTTPTYTWNAVGDATWYYLWVDDSTGNKINHWYTAEEAGCGSGTGTCRLSPGIALALGEVTWWIQAWNAAGYGPWSAPQTFTLSTGKPGKATLVSPAEQTSDDTPIYTWNAVESAAWYYLWVNDSTGTRLQEWYTAEQAGCGLGSSVCSLTPEIALQRGGAAWWIQAWNPNGYGPWSDALRFEVSAESLPGRATLVAPAGDITDPTPTYTWNAVQNAAEYYLWVDDDSGTRIQRWFTAEQADCADGVGTCALELITTVSGSGTWWIQTWNALGYGPWSWPNDFTVIGD